MIVRAVFFDDMAAWAVADRLRAEGFEAVVGREPFAGEDDDEDHPWAVVTDAPAVLVELLAEPYDGWLDDDPVAGPASRPPPLDLPLQPRRTNGPNGHRGAP